MVLKSLNPQCKKVISSSAPWIKVVFITLSCLLFKWTFHEDAHILVLFLCFLKCLSFAIFFLAFEKISFSQCSNLISAFGYILLKISSLITFLDLNWSKRHAFYVSYLCTSTIVSINNHKNLLPYRILNLFKFKIDVKHLFITSIF